MLGVAFILTIAIVISFVFRAATRCFAYWRASSSEHLRDAVLVCRIEGTFASVLAFLFMLASPTAALAIDGEEEVAIAFLLFGGFLFWLSLRLSVWGWRTKLSASGRRGQGLVP